MDETSALVIKYMDLVKIKANKAGLLLKSVRRSDIDADDLVSEGFLGLLSAIRTFDEEKGDFAAYANVCVSNRIKNAIFRGLKLSADNDFDLTQAVDERLRPIEEIVIEKESQKEISLKLEEILSALELKVFNLYLDSYSYSAIADKLCICVKAVDNALLRARGKLRKAYS